MLCLHGHPPFLCFAKGGLYDPCVMLDLTGILKNCNQGTLMNNIASIHLQQTVTMERVTTHAYFFLHQIEHSFNFVIALYNCRFYCNSANEHFYAY